MPDQISIKYWGTGGAYLISWATGDGQVGPGVIPPVADSVATKVMVSTSPFVNDSSVISSVGISLTYLYDYSADVQNGTLDYDYLNGAGVATSPVNYASPILHHALVEGLKPSTTYYYRVGDPKFWGGLSQPASFVTLPEPSAKTTYPFRLAVIADIGQTYNTSSMMKRLMASQIDAVSIIGDFTYGDNYDSSGCMYYSFTGVTGHYIGADPSTGLPSFITPAGNWCPFSGPEGDLSEQTYQAKWDTFMRLWQPVFSKFPVMFANGRSQNQHSSNCACSHLLLSLLTCRKPRDRGVAHWSSLHRPQRPLAHPPTQQHLLYEVLWPQAIHPSGLPSDSRQGSDSGRGL